MSEFFSENKNITNIILIDREREKVKKIINEIEKMNENNEILEKDYNFLMRNCLKTINFERKNKKREKNILEQTKKYLLREIENIRNLNENYFIVKEMEKEIISIDEILREKFI